MHYHYYRQCRDTAWRILFDTTADTMPISVLRICRIIGVTVSYYDLHGDELGRSVIIKQTPHILLRESMSIEMKRFVCAHELGHILLEHFEHGTQYSYMQSDRDSGIENGAEMFAMRLLCPACVLWGCGIHNYNDISDLCGVEDDYAKKRMQRMKELYKRDKFLHSPLERDVYNNFKPFIDKYIYNKQYYKGYINSDP